MRLTAVVCLLLWSTPILGQKVYKCADTDGDPIYSQQPCSDDPSKVEIVDTSRSLKTGSGPVSAPTEVEQMAARAGQRVVCDQRDREIAARYQAEFAKMDRQIADAKVRNPVQAVELVQRKADMIKARDAESKQSAALCAREMGL